MKQKTLRKLELKDRVNCYNTLFSDYPNLLYDKGWIIGVWMIGNYYKNKTNYYGAYPHSYRERVMSLFPDIPNNKILDLFAGNQILGNDTFDINSKLDVTYCGNAHELSKIITKKYKLILADPPYSSEDANHYGTPMINRNKVVQECYKILENNGFLVWLDQVYPMYSKEELKLVGTIGLIRSTNHRVRNVFIYQKIGNSINGKG